MDTLSSKKGFLVKYNEESEAGGLIDLSVNYLRGISTRVKELKTVFCSGLLLILALLLSLAMGEAGPREVKAIQPSKEGVRSKEIAALFSAQHPVGRKIIRICEKEGFAASIEAFRGYRRSQPSPRYYSIRSGERKMGKAWAVIREGWKFENLPRFGLTVPLAWASDPFKNRSWRYRLNAWDPLGPVLMTYVNEKDPRLLEFAARVALDWLYQHVENNQINNNPFAWYDMVVGCRASKLAYLLDAVSRSREFSSHQVWTLLKGASRHAAELRDVRKFKGHSNHGLFQAAGLLALAGTFPELDHSSSDAALSVKRIRGLLKRNYSDEGVYLEHSPYYHLLSTEILEWLVNYGLIRAPDIISIYEKAQHALAWFIHPRGFLARFGDTDLITMDRICNLLPSNHPRRSPALLYIQSQGKKGKAPEAAYRVFPDAGYAIFRSGWPKKPEEFKRASYLALAAAFHSQVHKQADEFTFEWSEGGQALIVDAGKFGYLGRTRPGSPLWKAGFWYSHPARIYVESTRAHNAVEIDGKDDPRRGVNPYGSAIKEWGEHKGVYFVEASLHRFSTVKHRRTLVFSPGKWLVVIDRLKDKDTPHKYTQWFHLGTELEVKRLDSGVQAMIPDGGKRLFIQPLLGHDDTRLSLIKGRKEPRLQGWTSLLQGEILPNWAVGFSQKGKRGIFATLLALTNVKPKIKEKAITINETGTYIQLAWVIDRQRQGIILTRHDKETRLQCLD